MLGLGDDLAVLGGHGLIDMSDLPIYLVGLRELTTEVVHFDLGIVGRVSGFG